jgi:aminoglycoside phosphotransferase (APT) family kinase protein
VAEVLTSRDRLLAGFDAMWADEDRRPRRLVHGDANLTNVYLDRAGAPRFLDWQFVARSDAYHDVAFFLIGALSTESRRGAEEDLLRTYLDARGPSAEPFDVAWDAYRRHALYGIIYALTPEAMQPAAIRDALGARFAHAVLDHRTFALLGV